MFSFGKSWLVMATGGGKSRSLHEVDAERFMSHEDQFAWLHIVCRVLMGGCSRGGDNWGTTRIPREDWGALALRNIREPPPLGPPPP